MSIIDSLIGVFAPHECVGCGTEGSLLCQGCAPVLPMLPEQCYRCYKPSLYGATCEACYTVAPLRKVVAATVYKGAAKQLVWKLKYTGAQAAARSMVQRMQLAFGGAYQQALVVPVPTASSRVRQRGYDQARLLAREFSGRNPRLTYVSVLARVTQTHQVGSGRQQRLQQLSGAFRVLRPSVVEGAHIILVDDVLTTGATLEAAARCLEAAGARQIDAIVFAQA